MEPDRLYPSIYGEDDEAFEIWNKKDRCTCRKITRFIVTRRPENVITSGSMVQDLADRVPRSIMTAEKKYGCGKPDCKVGCDCDRFMEVWNNVFTQFEGDGKGGYSELEQKNIDTGMGLERLAVVMQDVDSVFDIDTMKAIRDRICELCGKKYQVDALDDVSIRSDHRPHPFLNILVSDGVMPSNEDAAMCSVVPSVVQHVTAECSASRILSLQIFQYGY